MPVRLTLFHLVRSSDEYVTDDGIFKNDNAFLRMSSIGILT